MKNKIKTDEILCCFYLENTLSDKRCAKYKGIPNRPKRKASVCCSKRCGKCGGRGCNRRPGGKNQCCSRKVAKQPICGKNGRKAPCRIRKTKDQRKNGQTALISHQIDKINSNFTISQLSRAVVDDFHTSFTSLQNEIKKVSTAQDIIRIIPLNGSLAVVKKIKHFLDYTTIVQENDKYMNDSHILKIDGVKIKSISEKVENVMLSTIKWYWVVLVIVTSILFVIKMCLWQYCIINYKRACKARST